MTTAAPQTSPQLEPGKTSGPNGEFDPDEYRMTIGEHLEELRSRLFKGIIGLVLALFVCLFFAKRVLTFFCEPLIKVLYERNINPQLVFDEVTEGFMVYMKISLITALAISGPWLLYQLWQFVAAGLYPHERKYVTRYLPLSIVLMIVGMVFVFFIVLPMTLRFLIGFTIDIEIPIPEAPIITVEPGGKPPATAQIPILEGNPEKPAEGALWYDKTRRRLNVFIDGEVRVLPFGSNELVRPEITLDKYISLVVALLLAFGIAFQLPLVVLAIERIGVIDVPGLKRIRKYVYFAMVVVAAVITPGDAITATVAMVGPLILLYEFGIWLASVGRKPEPASA